MGAGSASGRDRAGLGRPALLDWRRVAADQQIDSLPVNLREQLAITAQRIAATLEFGAQVRERIAAHSEREGD